jgi:hypothetical protein
VECFHVRQWLVLRHAWSVDENQITTAPETAATQNGNWPQHWMPDTVLLQTGMPALCQRYADGRVRPE